ncbi:MAG: LD-carboxypeptidase [Zetaproteobacteria bacterium]|nr:LD-carboxypeptidase [Zetaproteobacteria bacterium]
MKKVHVFWPSSYVYTQNMDKSRVQGQECGLDFVDHALPCPHPDWPFTAFELEQRVHHVQELLQNPAVSVLWCARGGYGAAELLPYLDWQQLQSLEPKVLLGFSDASALLVACWTRLGWECIHAPMPATDSWHARSVGVLPPLLTYLAGSPAVEYQVSMQLTPVQVVGVHERVVGRIFGGCFSVLTNLMGTSFLPDDLSEMILFLEDTQESPPRLLRYWSQWKLARRIEQLKGVVVGTLGDANTAEREQVVRAMHRLTPEVPFWVSDDFGHHSINKPFAYGRKVEIDVARAVARLFFTA